MCRIQFHLRFLSISDATTTENRSEGLHTCRERSWISSPETRNSVVLSENRCAIAINTPLNLEVSLYSLVILTDLRRPSPHSFDGNQANRDMRVNLCGRFTGVAVFQVALRRILGESWRIRNSVLDVTSNALNVRVCSRNSLARINADFDCISTAFLVPRNGLG